MSILIVGFDSAWTARNSGAVVGVLKRDDGTYHELGPPQKADFDRAVEVVLEWQGEHRPAGTVQLIDQPTIVNNETGQRPVEGIVSCIVGRRNGGMQPANRARAEMFGREAPIWDYLQAFGGPCDPLQGFESGAIETYPVLAAIALKWTQPHGLWGRLPKYNPARKKTFLLPDWQHVCESARVLFEDFNLSTLAQWLEDVRRKENPRKIDQDGVDACLCLITALYLTEGRECLMVGNMRTGYVVVPHNADLLSELNARCTAIGRLPADWVHRVRWAPQILLK